MMHLMPTQNPRITITLTPATHARLQRLSQLTGNSQSAMVSEILDGSAEIFDRTIRLLDLAQSATEEIKSKARDDMDAAMSKLENQMGLSLEVFDQFGDELLKDVEAVRRRARRGSGKASASCPAPAVPTPMSNRGVRSTPKTAKNTTRTRT